jgi:hypothetical protein
MSIAPLYDSLTLGQRLSYRQTPDEGFFTAYAAAYANHAAGSAPAPDGGAPGASATDRLLAGLLGSVHTELSRRRGVGEADQAAYAAILNRAYTQGGMLDPVGFLQSLSPAELAVVQRNHCLAMPIEPAGLSREGAYNLLLPEGWRADLNGDDLIDVGAGKTIQFPPADAPAEFLDAWFAATRDMDEMDIATYGLVMFTAMHTLPIDGRSLERTLPPDRLDSYRQVVASYLEMIERFRGELPEGQYERDKAFFGLLMNLMG